MDPPIMPPDEDLEAPPVKLEVMLAAALSFPARTLSLLRVHQRILGLIVLGGGSAAGLIVSQAIAVQFSAAVVGLVVIVAVLRTALRMVIRPSDPLPPSSLPDGSFRPQLDTHVTERNDIVTFRDYRKLYSEATHSWLRGEFKDIEALRIAEQNLLELLIQAETRRLRFLTDDRVSLLVVEETGDTYSVQQSFGDVALKLRRGMTCPRNTSMDELLHRYEPYNYPAFFNACDRNYFLVALSPTEISVAARSLVEAAAGRYQSMYQFFKLIAVLSPPVGVGSVTRRA